MWPAPTSAGNAQFVSVCIDVLRTLGLGYTVCFRGLCVHLFISAYSEIPTYAPLCGADTQTLASLTWLYHSAELFELLTDLSCDPLNGTCTGDFCCRFPTQMWPLVTWMFSLVVFLLFPFQDIKGEKMSRIPFPRALLSP